MKTVLFACVHNAGRSQMAAAFFNALADAQQAHAISAGTQPVAAVYPEVRAVMGELGIELTNAAPRLLTPELAAGVSLLVTMGCGEACPFVPGARREDWPLPDPKGQPPEQVRQVRDEVLARVVNLIVREGWSASGPAAARLLQHHQQYKGAAQ